MDEILQKIGARLKEFREYQKLTQSDMAAMISMSRPTYISYESGSQSILAKHLYILSEIHDRLNIHWLVTGQGNMFIDNSISSPISLIEIEERAEVNKRILKIEDELLRLGNNMNALWHRERNDISPQSIQVHELEEKVKALEKKVKELEKKQNT